MRSAAADNDRRAPEESPDKSGLASSPSTSPIDRIDESLIEDVSLIAGNGPISDRRCVRRRRCRARKPRWILTTARKATYAARTRRRVIGRVLFWSAVYRSAVPPR